MGTYQETSSQSTCQRTLSQLFQLAEPLWTYPGLKSGLSVCELISAVKKKSTGREQMNRHSPRILASEKKATTITMCAAHQFYLHFHCAVKDKLDDQCLHVEND